MSGKTKFEWANVTLELRHLLENTPGPSLSEVPRPAFEQCDKALKDKFASKKIGFYQWPKEISASEIELIKATAARLKRDFRGALLCGIGGSHLGGAAILDALSPKTTRKEFPLHWLSNIDAWSIERAEDFVRERKGKVATVLISKSGSTTETLAGFCHLANELDEKGIVAITDPHEGELRRMAKQYGWESFAVPPNVGGRFSVLTPVGLLPCALGDVDIEGLLKGANSCREWLESHGHTENPAYLFAWALFEWDRRFHHPLQYLMPYAAPLKLFADWYVQLFGESLGKRLLTDKAHAVGPTPVGALGTTDQHSLLQLFREGPSDKIVGFLDTLPGGAAHTVGNCKFDLGRQSYLASHTFEEISTKASIATEQSLRNGGVPTYRLSVSNLNAHAMGGLIFFFETACAFAGELYGVDAFNQPGVEESKKLLQTLL